MMKVYAISMESPIVVVLRRCVIAVISVRVSVITGAGLLVMSVLVVVIVVVRII